ncbi:protein ALP1-like [Penaeus japonicus]|uniref:protein ALP1-like n=1 Tax=Penaeus japonicus TaxID=27405 RepID=UPI001C7126EB|nr:protein ALP1-like [Penaeus japonicus]
MAFICEDLGSVLQGLVEAFGSPEEDLMLLTPRLGSAGEEDLRESGADEEVALRIAVEEWQARRISPQISWETALSQKDFLTTFRVTRPLFKYLVYEWERERQSDLWKVRVHPADRQVLAALYYLGNLEPITSVAERFSMMPSTIHNVIVNFTNFLETLGDGSLTWPSAEEKIRCSEIVRQNGGLPGVFGALDAALIKIRAPAGDEKAHYVYKKSSTGLKCAVVLQFVVDAELLLRDVYLAAPSDANRVSILQSSRLWELLHCTVAAETHIVAPAVYPLAPTIMVPYVGEQLSPQEAAFNRLHSEAFKLSRSAMTVLKSRFRRLQLLDQKLCNVFKIILSTCILHNIAIMREGPEVLQELQMSYRSGTDEDGWHAPPQDAVADFAILGGEEKRLYLTAVLS